MLSQHDRRALAEIEARLRASDPGLARRLERAPAASAPHRKRLFRRLSLAGSLLGLMLLATALTVRSADAAVSAAVVFVAVSAGAALWTVSWFRHRRN